jgi:hypothetical protein
VTTLRNCAQVIELSQENIALIGTYQEIIQHAVCDEPS